MGALPVRRHLVVVGLLAGLALCAGGGWWLAVHSDTIAFLPGHRGAAWVVYPEPASADIRQAAPDVVRFRREFQLPGRPDRAWLSCCAFRQAGVWLNGVGVSGLALDGRGWKHPRQADVTTLLQAGQNCIEVVVTNVAGPPALWLRLQAGEEVFATDASWEALRAQAPWRAARLARQPPPIEPGGYLAGQEPLPGQVRRVAVPLVIAGLIAWFAGAFGRRVANGLPLRWLNRAARPAAVLGLLLVAWVALWANNLPQLPRLFGFDTEGHEQYVRHLQETGTLPLATAGWQMYQPPLYYLAAAAVLSLADLTPADDSAALLLRAVNGLVGWGHCVLVFLCARLLFPQQGWKQVVVTLFAGLLPAHLLLAHYVTNEVLAATLVTGAVWFCLRTLRAESQAAPSRAGMANALGAGLLLGLALLTKFSAVLAVPVLACALAMPVPGGQPSDGRRRLSYAGVLLGASALISGWHYARVWMQLGHPLVGNWDAASGFAWWQCPGYRTVEYYTRFGEVLVRPLFSSFASFWDGLYATLWGDGLVSSAAWLAFRPPWNYDLMGAAWWLAAVGTGLILLGMAVGVVGFVRRPDAVGVVMLGLPAVFGVGLLYMSLRVPSYAQVKAFYGLPALLPLGAAMVNGWDWLARGRPALQRLLGAWFVTWALAVITAFWVRPTNPETPVVQGIWALDRGRVAEAARHYEQALRLDPTHWTLSAALAEAVRATPREPVFRLLLAESQRAQDKYAEAASQYQEVLRLDTNNVSALNNLAWLLATCPEPALLDPAEAVRLAERACALTANKEPQVLGTLAAALARAGRFDDAVRVATLARDLATQAGDARLALENDRLLARYRSGRPFQESHRIRPSPDVQ